MTDILCICKKIYSLTSNEQKQVCPYCQLPRDTAGVKTLREAYNELQEQLTKSVDVTDAGFKTTLVNTLDEAFKEHLVIIPCSHLSSLYDLQELIANRIVQSFLVPIKVMQNETEEA